MLLILPLRPGDDNEELRYALRSWETNLLIPGGLELWTVGDKPSWLEPDRHLKGNRFDSIQFNVFDNVLHGAEAACSETTECLFMNDDFFCMDPMSSVLPVRRNISLARHCAMFNNPAMSWWPRSLDLTASWLAEEGLAHPWSFEVHRPLAASPEGMRAALSSWVQGDYETVPQWRTAYGNLMGVYAYPVADCKLGPEVDGIGMPWLSTTDLSWRRHGRRFVSRFPHPSRWEH